MTNKGNGSPPDRAVTEREKSKSEPSWFIAALLSVLILGITCLIILRMHDYQLADASNRAMMREAGQPTPPPPPPRRWQEVYRPDLLSQSFTIETWLGWPASALRAGSSSLRWRRFLVGRFAASEPGVNLVVMDQQNYQRLQLGYPPLIIANAAAGQEISIPVPEEGRAVVFFRAPAERPGMAGVRSLGDLLVYAIKDFAAGQRDPARVTAELQMSIECNCTDDEAAQLRRGPETIPPSAQTSSEPQQAQPANQPAMAASTGPPVPQPGSSSPETERKIARDWVFSWNPFWQESSQLPRERPPCDSPNAVIYEPSRREFYRGDVEIPRETAKRLVSSGRVALCDQTNRPMAEFPE